MALLRADGVAKSFGALELFAGVTVVVPRRARIGLVGANGVGKTTLLRILAGELVPDRGRVARAKGVRVGLLPQETGDTALAADRTPELVLLDAVTELRRQEAMLDEMAARMAKQSVDDQELRSFGALLDAFERAGGYTYRQRIQQVLSGLGFEPAVANRPLRQLSGGERRRIMLGRLLLEQPDLMLLDEPTNHLDAGMLEWLEGFLIAFPGAFIVVSHDRYFLDRLVDTIWELSASGLEVYRGNYTRYVQERGQRWELRQKQYHAFVELATKELEFIRRTIAAQQTGVALGRLVRLARRIDAVSAGGLAILESIDDAGWARATGNLCLPRPTTNIDSVAARLREIRRPELPTAPFRLHLRPRRQAGDRVLRTKDLVVGYPDRQLFTVGDLELRPGDRVAILGPNGSGKTTFLRTLLGEVRPLSGAVQRSRNLDIGYLSQVHHDADGSATVLACVRASSTGSEEELRRHLAQYGFGGDTVHRPVAALSGGERARLAFALLALQQPNLLLLDEPTNHLDVLGQEALEEALQGFPGSIVMVSHDRYLVDRLASQLWLIEAGKLRCFCGSYREYVASRKPEPIRRSPGGGRPSSGGPESGARSSLSKNERQRLERQAAAWEERIRELEAALETASNHLQAAGASGDFTAIEQFSLACQALTAELQAAEREWLAVMEKLETAAS